MHVTRATDPSRAAPLAEDDATLPARRGPPGDVRGAASDAPGAPAHADDALARFVDAHKIDGVVYLGMNGAGGQRDHEAKLLAARSHGPFRAVAHGEADAALGPDHARLRSGAVVDLADADGACAFADELGLEAGAAEAVVSCLLGAAPGSRDELAGLARVLSDGERGLPIPSRLVISGHSIGDGVYDGEGRAGWVHFADIFALARALPRGAAAIDDVMLSACNSGHRTASLPRGDFTVGIEAWGEAFPRLRTVWAYAAPTDSHSPTGDVALVHLAAWEASTRGAAAHLEPARAIARANGGHPAGYERSVAVWERAP